MCVFSYIAVTSDCKTLVRMSFQLLLASILTSVRYVATCLQASAIGLDRLMLLDRTVFTQERGIIERSAIERCVFSETGEMNTR